MAQGLESNKRWLPREGFTADVTGTILKRTLLSPSSTIPLLLLAHFTSKGNSLAAGNPSLFQGLKVLVSLGLLRWLNGWMNRRALNNRLLDIYIWEREIAIVTGGSDGIGKNIALLLAQNGVKVAVLDIQPLKYDPPASFNISFHQCDITFRENISTVAEEIRSNVGEPTILINNAGILIARSILDGTDEETMKMFQVNTLSHYALTREFLPSMIRHNHGVIVTIASQAAYLVAPGMIDYAATKAAALAFHEGITAELTTRYNAPRVRTVLITQGFTRTYLIRDLSPENTWFNPLLDPKTVAEKVVQQILTGSSGQVNLPGSPGFLASHIRSFPHWFQNRARERSEKFMRPPTNRKV